MRLLSTVSSQVLDFYETSAHLCHLLTLCPNRVKIKLTEVVSSVKETEATLHQAFIHLVCPIY